MKKESRFQRISKNFDRLKYGPEFLESANTPIIYQVSANKTVDKIKSMMVRRGARSMEEIYLDSDPLLPVELVFKMTAEGHCVRFKFICNYKPVMQADNSTRATAIRKTWTLIKDWVESQLQAVDSGIITIEQAFLLFALSKDGKTFFEKAIEKINELKV